MFDALGTTWDQLATLAIVGCAVAFLLSRALRALRAFRAGTSSCGSCGKCPIQNASPSRNADPSLVQITLVPPSPPQASPTLGRKSF